MCGTVQVQAAAEHGQLQGQHGTLVQGHGNRSMAARRGINIHIHPAVSVSTYVCVCTGLCCWPAITSSHSEQEMSCAVCSRRGGLQALHGVWREVREARRRLADLRGQCAGMADAHIEAGDPLVGGLGLGLGCFYDALVACGASAGYTGVWVDKDGVHFTATHGHGREAVTVGWVVRETDASGTVFVGEGVDEALHAAVMRGDDPQTIMANILQPALMAVVGNCN